MRIVVSWRLRAVATAFLNVVLESVCIDIRRFPLAEEWLDYLEQLLAQQICHPPEVFE